MKKNWFVKLLCIYLAVCMAVPNLPFMKPMAGAGYVYASEPDAGSELAAAQVSGTEDEEAEYCIRFLKDNNLENYITLPVMIDYEYTAGDTKGRLEKADLLRRKHQDICDRFVRDARNKGYDGEFMPITVCSQKTCSPHLPLFTAGLTDK